MKRLPVVFSFLALILLTTSCSSPKEMADQDQKKMPQPAGPGIAPGHCRIVATVMKIESVRSSDPSNPCSKAPCLATVRIDEILGYGSAFGRTLHQGDEMKVQFTLTLGPTKEILPEVTPPLPGLSVGSKFQADIAAGPAPMMGSKDVPPFATDLYKVKD